jgi:CubicO group peptidase (beta-lactamase class C family)
VSTDRKEDTMTALRFKLTAATIAAAAALLLVLVLPGTASASPVVPSAVFDPSSTGWVSLRDLTGAQFAQRFDELAGKGMMVVDLEVDVIGGQYRVGAVFRSNPDGRGWYSHRDLTDAQFHARWEELKGKGYRLVDQETYVTGGTRYYAGVFVENREQLAWASYRNVTSDEFSDRFDEYRDAGYMPIDVDVYPMGSGLRYGAVWVKNTEGLSFQLRRGLTSAEYGAAFDTYKRQGLRSVDVESVQTSQGQRYAGIWIRNVGGRGWFARRDLTATQYRNYWNLYTDMGYRLDDYEKYETAGGTRYAGIFRQTSKRPGWKLRGTVDGYVQKELDDFKVPGISVAVSVDGEFVYQRGFGFQDKADGIWMHGNSVNRIASVSKAVAGVLALRMDAKYASLSMSDTVRKHLPQLPSHHSYTVQQSVMNRSCVVSYPDGFDEQNQTHYDTALDAVEEFMDQALGCTPGSWLYSTHAYTVLGAVFEKVAGKPVEQIVFDEITMRFGLDTLRPESLAGPLPDRVQLYETDGDEYNGDDTSNKTLGGGLVSTARDLVRFGDGILDGTILTPAQRTTLWTPIGSYAYGWDVGSAAGGQRVVGKPGGQPGAKSYLRIYPDDGIVISVLSNRWKGGHSAAGLSGKIGELILTKG